MLFVVDRLALTVSATVACLADSPVSVPVVEGEMLGRAAEVDRKEGFSMELRTLLMQLQSV